MKMKYDFTTIMDRQGKDAIAVDIPAMGKAFGPRNEAFDFIPMWIADMNFATARSSISSSENPIPLSPIQCLARCFSSTRSLSP